MRGLQRGELAEERGEHRGGKVAVRVVLRRGDEPARGAVVVDALAEGGVGRQAGAQQPVLDEGGVELREGQVLPARELVQPGAAGEQLAELGELQLHGGEQRGVQDLRVAGEGLELAGAEGAQQHGEDAEAQQVPEERRGGVGGTGRRKCRRCRRRGR